MLSYFSPELWITILSSAWWVTILAFFFNNLTRTLILLGIGHVLLRLGLMGEPLTTKQPSVHQTRSELRHVPLSFVVLPLTGATGAWLLYQVGHVGVLSSVGVPWWALALQFVGTILLHDAYFYWIHRLMHHPRVYPRIHGVHHHSVIPRLVTTYSFDPYEAVLNALFIPLYLMLMGFVLGGVHIVPLLLFLITYTVFNIYHHSSHEFLPRWWASAPVSKYISTSTFHFLHHRENRGNFGFYFTVWDRLCGTLVPDYEERFRTRLR